MDLEGAFGATQRKKKNLGNRMRLSKVDDLLVLV